MSKYAELRDHLRNQRLSRLRMSFREIEDVLGFSLPKSARLYQAWWANQDPPSSQSSSWVDAGWVTEELDLGAGKITFAKVLGQSANARPPVPSKRPEQAKVASGAPITHSAAPVDEHESRGTTSLSLHYSWARSHGLSLNLDGRIVPGLKTKVPGLYRFRLTGVGAERIYIGEAVNLARRMYHYCNPGPRQETNIRLNGIFRQHLCAGGEVEVDVIVNYAQMVVGRSQCPLDLSNKFHRRLLENAAIVDEQARKSIILNN